MRTLYLAAVLFLTLSAPAQNNSGEQLYSRAMDAVSGSGPSRNDLEAIDYFKRSAELGYVPAQVALGFLYDTGTLVPGSASQAAEWYRKAADNGDPLAQWLLGRIYFQGGGVPQDVASAEKWLRAAADQGNPFAQYLLGRTYSDRDYTKAPALYRAAAEQGLPQAQYYYGKALKDGRGVPQDRHAAYTWLLMSIDGGYEAGRMDLTEIEGLLLPAEISRAKSKAREMEETMNRSVLAHGCTGWEGEFYPIPTPPPLRTQRFCHERK
jgi:TPR repeat protein